MQAESSSILGDTIAGIRRILGSELDEIVIERVESECGAVAVGRTYRLPPLSSGGASLVRPWLRFHTPLIEPDVQIYRVAQPLLAFAPTEPAVRRYRSGLFREDRRLLLTHVG